VEKLGPSASTLRPDKMQLFHDLFRPLPEVGRPRADFRHGLLESGSSLMEPNQVWADVFHGQVRLSVFSDLFSHKNLPKAISKVFSLVGVPAEGVLGEVVFCAMSS